MDSENENDIKMKVSQKSSSMVSTNLTFKASVTGTMSSLQNLQETSALNWLPTLLPSGVSCRCAK